MTQINRRKLIGVAGATMALAACNRVESGDGSSMADSSNKLKFTGVDDQYGEDPHNTAPAKPPAGGFSPNYIAIAYIQLDSGDKTIVRHGYTEVTHKEDESDTDFATRQLAEAEMLINEAAKPNWKKNPKGHPNKQVNFEKFTFGQQMRMYFVVDNETVKFDDRKRNGNYANLVRFTEYRTTHDMVNFDPKRANENHAFFGAKLVPIKIGNKTRQALQLDNWYVGADAKPIVGADTATHQFYAMNLQLLWQAGEAGSAISQIPFIIDPDGGNMGSQP